MPGNKTFRGPDSKQPRCINRACAAALVPGTFVEDNGTNLAQITTAVGKRPLLLGVNDLMGKTFADNYASGETGIAYDLEGGQVYTARLAAATYAKGAVLTIGASGYLTAATAASRVVAYFDDTPGAYTAGQLADVIIADGYTA